MLVTLAAAAPTRGADDPFAAAKSALAQAQASAHTWDGLKSGAKAQAAKFIVDVSTDQNGGALGVRNGVVEAAKAVGWRSQVIDGQGTV